MEIMQIDSLRPAMAELERALAWAGDRITENGVLKSVQVVPSIQTRGKKARCLGHFWPDKWSTREGELRAEVNFSAEALNREPPAIIATAIHELAHVWNHARNIKDCATNDRHNKKFKIAAESLGLVCTDPVDSYGYGYTQLSDTLRQAIAEDFIPDAQALNLFRLVKPPRKSQDKTKVYECQCPVKVRVAKGVELSAKCEDCLADFIKV